MCEDDFFDPFGCNDYASPEEVAALIWFETPRRSIPESPPEPSHDDTAEYGEGRLGRPLIPASRNP